MQRAALERQRAIRVWRRHVAMHGLPIVCPCELQAGRFRKDQRVSGCGNTRCFLCHPDKAPATHRFGNGAGCSPCSKSSGALSGRAL